MDASKLIAELERDEGMRLKVYFDSRGIATIGVGRNLHDKGVSQEEAYILLNHDIEKVRGELDAHLSWWQDLDEVRQRVLANMCFNMGIRSLLSFSVTLGHVRNQRWEQAAAAMLQSSWAVEVGPRARRLAQMMRTGDDHVGMVV